MTAFIDFSDKKLTRIGPTNLPPDIYRLDISCNSLKSLPQDLFSKNFQLWELDAHCNKLSSLEALVSYKAMGLLDVSDNCLTVDELLQIRHMCIQDIRLSSNRFQRFTSKEPLLLIALLNKCWIIDGHFVSDYERNQADEFRKTLKFGETLLAARPHKETQLAQMGTSQAATDYLQGNTIKFSESGVYMNSRGSMLIALTERPQLERLEYLSTFMTFNPSEYSDDEKLGLMVSILGFLWMGAPISVVMKSFSVCMWATESEVLLGFKQWQLYTILYKLSVNNPIVPYLEVEEFMRTGHPPYQGSTPRLIVSHYLQKSGYECDDIKFLDSYLRYCDYKDDDSAYKKLVEEIPVPFVDLPKAGDVIAVIHPVTKKWINATIESMDSGRIKAFTGDDYVQLPFGGVFWDGRGVWRQSAPREQRQKQVQTHLDSKIPQIKLSKSMNVAEPTVFIKQTQKMMKESKFIDRTVSQLVRQHGIKCPIVCHKPHTIKVPASRRPTALVDDVVNIVFANEVYYGKKLRRFHVKSVGVLTKKATFEWVNEEDITPDDAARLTEIYKEHIAAKMRIIPGI